VRSSESEPIVDHFYYTFVMLTSITPREAPDQGPTTDLDRAICQVLENGNFWEPREIQRNLPGIELPQIYARLRVLVQRGVLVRDTPPGAPRRGPGAGRYCKA
jgi:hypothetical protein